MLRRSVSFGNAVLLVVGLPVRSLAVSTTVEGKTTASTGRKLGSALIPFGRGTVAADPAIAFRTLLVIRRSHHARR